MCVCLCVMQRSLSSITATSYRAATPPLSTTSWLRTKYRRFQFLPDEIALFIRYLVCDEERKKNWKEKKGNARKGKKRKGKARQGKARKGKSKQMRIKSRQCSNNAILYYNMFTCFCQDVCRIRNRYGAVRYCTVLGCPCKNVPLHSLFLKL